MTLKKEIQKLWEEKYKNFERGNTKTLKGEIQKLCKEKYKKIEKKRNTFEEQLAVVAPLAPPDIENSLCL